MVMIEIDKANKVIC